MNVIISGSSVPERLEWRIISTNGQLQSQFETEDFPDLHIGTNELAWKGTDLNGNLLPGGMYIYTLKITLEGKQTTRMGKLVLWYTSGTIQELSMQPEHCNPLQNSDMRLDCNLAI